MQEDISHDALDAALERCGATWDAAQAHGLLSSRLAVAGAGSGFDWLEQVLDGTARDAPGRTQCEALLRALFEETYRQLAERLSEFTPLLPDDSDPAGERTRALAHWCEGFLHGLVSARDDEALKQRLAAEPLADLVRDLLEITRAAVDDEADRETNETAYAELVEYLRVAAQLCYEELAEVRHAEEPRDGSEALH